MHQPGIGDFGIVEPQVLSWLNPWRCTSPASVTWVLPRPSFELTQPLEMHHPGVGDFGVVEYQSLELTQPLEMH